MKLTAITCTYERPEALALCARYMGRQTRPPDQWLILAGPEPMREKVLAAVEGGQVNGDGLIFVEDDDWFGPGWLAWCEKQLEKYAIVGQGNALFYQVRYRWWSECRNVRHASLCQTAITSDVYESLCSTIKAYDSPFFDTRLWMLDESKYLHLPQRQEDRHVIGIKGMPGGRRGYSGEHVNSHPCGIVPDPSLFKLWQLIGDEAENYLPFHDLR